MQNNLEADTDVANGESNMIIDLCQKRSKSMKIRERALADLQNSARHGMETQMQFGHLLR